MAIGQTLYSAGALGAITPVTAPATLDTRNLRPVLDFDPGTNEQAYFQGVLPANYSGGNLAVTIHWMATTATTLVARWTAQFERLEASGPDLDSSGFQAAVSVNTTTSGTSGVINATVITLTALDSAVAGDSFRILIERTGADAADTMAGDAELLDISVKEV